MDLNELVFFTSNPEDWNFNKLVTNPDLDPYTNKLVNNNGFYN